MEKLGLGLAITDTVALDLVTPSDRDFEIKHSEDSPVALHGENTGSAVMISEMVEGTASTDGDVEFRNAIERDLYKLVIKQAEIETYGERIEAGGSEEEGKDEGTVKIDNSSEEKREAEDALSVEEENETQENVGAKSGDAVTKLGGDGHSNGKWINYPMRPDADDCSFYMKFGSCKFGSHCKFNHPPRRKNEGVKGRVCNKEESSERTGQNECKYYLTSGGCRYGKDCKYSHSADKFSTPNTLEFNFLGLPIRSGEKECPYYMRTGSCKFGSNCRFHHPQPSTMVGNDSPSGYGNNGSLPSPLVSSSSFSPSWSSTRAFNGTSPFVPLMLSPTQDAHSSNPQWNGYQAATYQRSNGSLPVPPAFALNNLPTESLPLPPAFALNNLSTESLPVPPAFALNNLPTEIHLPMQRQNDMAFEEYPERPGEPECSYFLRNGDCKFKSSCKFHHPKGHVSKATATPFAINEKGLPYRPEQPICTHYQRYGLCKYGPMCRYNHPLQFSN